MVIAEDWYFWSHRLHVAQAAQRAGYEVAVATAAGELQGRIEAEGFRYFPIQLDRGSTNPLAEAGSVASVTAVLARFRPDVVHLVAHKLVLYGSIAAALTGAPAVVCAVAGMGYLFMGDGLKRRALRGVVQRAYGSLVRRGARVSVILQNPDDQRELAAAGMIDPAQVTMICGSGVDTERFAPAPPPPGVPVVLTHSRMLVDKGIGEIAEAARILRDRGVPVRFRLVGDPDEQNPSTIPAATLRAWAEEGLVEHLGRRSDIPEQLAACHIACLPSYREGAPLSLIEAAAAGRPLVSTDVPGCREIVRDGDNGFLVPVRDGAALARAIEALATDPALRERMGRRSRERALAEWSRAHVAQATLDVYAAQLARHPRGQRALRKLSAT
ncbi:MAG: glycosyltransferase family 4 protein [Sandaracinaceae bacterium]|nr:glycosyltransferase family 4 protein [Sandaracinaceae bacterium]